MDSEQQPQDERLDPQAFRPVFLALVAFWTLFGLAFYWTQSAGTQPAKDETCTTFTRTSR